MGEEDTAPDEEGRSRKGPPTEKSEVAPPTASNGSSRPWAQPRGKSGSATGSPNEPISP